MVMSSIPGFVNTMDYIWPSFVVKLYRLKRTKIDGEEAGNVPFKRIEITQV